MKALITLLQIRFLQVYRLLVSVGWPLLILGIPIIIIFLLGLYERSTNGYTLALIYSLAILSIHFGRSDRFHLMQLGYTPRLIFVLEYFIVGVILGITQSVLVATFQNLGVMMFMAVVIGVLPQIKLKSLRNLFFFPVDWLPIHNFEWRAGMRKVGWVFFAIILVSSGLSYISPLFPLVGLILINIFTTSWYSFFEAFALFDQTSTPLIMLRKKVSTFIFSSTIVSLPIILGFMIVHSALWYLLLVVMFFGWMINTFAIVYKYAHYHPSRRSGQSDLPVAIFSMSALVPFFAPVCLVYLTIYSKRAVQNLNDIYADN